MRVGIVGAGMAGLACAEVLASRGAEVRLFDKGRGPGGRMSTRRVHTPMGDAAFDHGAQYFTARDPRFVETLKAWQHRGVVAAWPQAGEEAWVGMPAMNGIVGHMAEPHAVEFRQFVRSLERSGDGWHFRLDGPAMGPFDIAVVAVPAEQAATLMSLHDFEMACTALRARSSPCWTGLFAFAERLGTPLDVIRDRGVIAWAARNNSKPGRTGLESWVVQAHPGWTQEHCEGDPDDISKQLLDALGSGLEITVPVPVVATAHRWRFAMSSGTGDCTLWNPEKRLAACGDWLVGPRVEAAWLSGHELGHRITRAWNC